MFSQKQLNWFLIPNAFYHLLNHPVRQGQTEGGGGHRRVGLGSVRASKGQARLWNLEGRHFEVRMPGEPFKFRE